MELVEYYNANPKRNLAKHKGKQLQQDQLDQTFSSCEKSTLPAAPPKRIPIAAATKFSRNHFDPTPTTSGKCPHLRIDVLLDNRVFVAGAHVHGRLEVSCNTDSKIHIGEVLMEFVGYEGILSFSLFIQFYCRSNAVFTHIYFPMCSIKEELLIFFVFRG